MNMAGYSCEDLEIWRRAKDLGVECYKVTMTFPPSEACGLSSQLQRAAVSAAANVAEGQARQHRGEFILHLSIACGSLAELRTPIRIALRLKYTPEKKAAELVARCDVVGRLLHGLLRFLRNRDRTAETGLEKSRQASNRKTQTGHNQSAAEIRLASTINCKPATSNLQPGTGNHQLPTDA
jgi:four helix bundle protein